MTQHLFYHLSISQTHWQASSPPRHQRAVELTRQAPSDSTVRACAADSGHARHDDHRPVITGFTYRTHRSSPLIYESGKLTKVVSWCYKLPRRLARLKFSRSCGVLPVAEARIPSSQPATHNTGRLLRRVDLPTRPTRGTSPQSRSAKVTSDDEGWTALPSSNTIWSPPSLRPAVGDAHRSRRSPAQTRFPA